MDLEKRRSDNRERMRQWRLAHGIQPRVHDKTQRFWAKVDKDGPNGCWVWTGDTVRGPHRYGRLWTDKRPVTTHRYSWQIHFGPIPDGALVCHHCDNPPCVRPDHLFLGTDRDNIHDMIRKGRAYHPRGEAHQFYRRGDLMRGERGPNARLKDKQVAEIRRLYATGKYTQTALAEQFGVVQSHVSKIVLGKSRI